MIEEEVSTNGEADAFDHVSTSAREKKKPFWAPKHRVICKGLPFCATLGEIKNFFSDCGDVGSVTQQLDDKSRWTGSVMVKFDCQASLEKALTLNGSVWTGSGGDGVRYVKIEEYNTKRAVKNNSRTDNSECSVVIANLPKDVDDSHIRKVFDDCGSIKSIKIAKQADGETKGYAHIEFESIEAKNAALLLDGNKKMKKRTIKVTGVKPPSSKGKKRKPAGKKSPKGKNPKRQRKNQEEKSE